MPFTAATAAPPATHGQPHGTGGRSVADIVEHLMDEFGHRLELHVIARVVLGCRADLDCSPAAALPELIERLARQRLLDTAPHRTSALAEPLSPVGAT